MFGCTPIPNFVRMKSTRINDILPAVIGNITAHNATQDETTRTFLRYGLRRLIQYWTEAEDKVISTKALSVCVDLGIDWTKLTKGVKGKKKGSPIILGEHPYPLMEFVRDLYNTPQEDIKEKLESYPPICWVTRSEDNRLNREGYRSNRPEGWEKTYQICGIQIVKNC